MVRGYFSRIKADKKRWTTIKEDEDLHKKHLDQAKKYREKNNDKINKYLRNYRKDMTIIANQIGNCTRCLKPKKKDNYKMCEKCREKVRSNYRKKVNKIKMEKNKNGR